MLTLLLRANLTATAKVQPCALKKSFFSEQWAFSPQPPFRTTSGTCSRRRHVSCSAPRPKRKKTEVEIQKEVSVVMAQLSKLSPASEQSLGSMLKKYVKKLGPECVLGTLWELIRIEDWSRAFEAFDTIRNQSWFQKDAMIYSELIRVAGRAGEVNHAFELFKAMDTHDCPRTTTVYTAMIDVFGKHGRLKEAKLLFVEARNTEGCKPDEGTYCALLRVLCRFNLMEEAEERFQEMPDCGCLQNHLAYNIMVDGYGRAGDIRKMQLRFLEMCHAGIVPDLWSYNSLIRNFGKWGRMDDMEACFENMQANGCSPDHLTIQALVESYARKGDLKKMSNSLNHAFRRKYRVSLRTLNSAIEMCGKVKDFSGMEKWFNKVKYLKLTPTITTLSSIVRVYGAAGLGNHIERVASDMRNLGLQPNNDYYLELLSAYEEARDFERLHKIKKEMMSANIDLSLV